MKAIKHALFAALTLGLAAASAQAQTSIKIGYAVSNNSHYGAGADAFCATLESASANRYKCQQFPNATLGNEREMVESAQIGALDVAFVSSGTVGNFVPDIRILDIPFLFRDNAHAHHTLDGQIGQDLLKKFPTKGLIAMAWGENGFRHITTNHKAINQPADLANVKLRTMENRVHIESFKALGALPTPMAWPEVYTALQQGTIDGQENPLSILVSSKLWQVQTHLALTAHIYSPTLLIASPATWGKLSKEDQAIFMQAAKDGAAAQRQRVSDEAKTAVALLEKEGMTVTQPSTADFQAALAPTFKKFASTYGQALTDIQAIQ